MGVQNLILDDAEAVVRANRFTMGTTWHGANKIKVLAYDSERTLFYFTGENDYNRGQRYWYPARIILLIGCAGHRNSGFEINANEPGKKLTEAYVRSLIDEFKRPQGMEKEIQYLANKALRLREQAEAEKERQAKLREQEDAIRVRANCRLNDLVRWENSFGLADPKLPKSLTWWQLGSFIQAVDNILDAHEKEKLNDSNPG